MINNLNENHKIYNDFMQVMEFEQGFSVKDDDDFLEHCVDFRGKISDFTKNLNECTMYKQSFDGIEYFTGDLQKRKGDKHESFVMIEDGRWVIVYSYLWGIYNDK